MPKCLPGSACQLDFTDKLSPAVGEVNFFFFLTSLKWLPSTRKANLTGQTGLSWTKESEKTAVCTKDWDSSARDLPAPPAGSARKCKRPPRKGQKAITGSGQWMALLAYCIMTRRDVREETIILISDEESWTSKSRYLAQVHMTLSGTLDSVTLHYSGGKVSAECILYQAISLLVFVQLAR